VSHTIADESGTEVVDDHDLAGRFSLLRAVVYKRALLLVRYPLNTVAQIVGIYLFFAVIFFGGQAVVSQVASDGTALTGTFDGLIIGWFLWTMSLTAYFSLAMNITRESQWGTLEQLYMSPYGFGTVMAAKVVANVLESLLWGALILFLMLVTTGQTLSVNLITIGVLSVLALLSVVGIGFVFAGLALLYKRIENVSQLMQFVILGLISAPAIGIPSLRLLPLVQGSAMLQKAMQDSVRLWEFSPADLALLVGTAVVYSLLGYLVFRWCTNRARKSGVMGHY
jgi:ABC-2 type transport system permease protein